MKTLIIVIHPNIQKSITNKRWLEELRKYPDSFDIHQLYETYPDEKLDIRKEQELIEIYDKIVFQFPLYWFSSPPLLKKWFDEVLLYGWAYGSKSGFKLKNKKIGLAISAGASSDDYTPEGVYGHSLKQITIPFELTFKYVKANYVPFFASYDMDLNTSPEKIEKSVSKYMDYLNSFD
ncbi:NAD(P)H-dependent oxidoreductase [Zunongwangia pacifica]|uniref:NAD(P)H-dependent oxidoreductase n=1 Tax=Zunongwangia pacifica TaxID=2911062 RepID=A0A9X1ZMW2_9FLAO|nr:NAD(P)H-dependent oxidoreductase [Zunongwangia pacifica]MCL6217552.1 NAD(P)H-dependent oxidoreductase [Zunongwangia pacifica]